jgi:hypothetical protein
MRRPVAMALRLDARTDSFVRLDPHLRDSERMPQPARRRNAARYLKRGHAGYSAKLAEWHAAPASRADCLPRVPTFSSPRALLLIGATATEEIEHQVRGRGSPRPFQA